MKINKHEIGTILMTINKKQWEYDSTTGDYYFIPDKNLKITKIHDPRITDKTQTRCNIDYCNSTINGNISYHHIFSQPMGIKVSLTGHNNHSGGYTIISYPIVKRDSNTGKLWIDVLTDPKNQNGFPATTQNIQALGVQNQVDQLNAEVEEKLLADQDSPSSTEITRPIRP
jgi:hypothetical protein